MTFICFACLETWALKKRPLVNPRLFTDLAHLGAKHAMLKWA